MKKAVYRGEIIWDKQNILSGTAWGSWKSPNNPSIRDHHEYILIFRKEGNRRGTSDITDKEFIEYTKAIWNVMPETRLQEHPAPFPIALAKRAIKLFSFKEETILDPFMGAGTTGVAAVQLGRKFLGFEISQSYCQIANKRTSQKNLMEIEV
jgi:site-specific DNA-methyltransferase (adenine-specific)